MELVREPIIDGYPPPVSRLCRYLSEKSPQPMVVVDGVLHVISYVNPAFSQLVGKASDELVGRLFAEAVPEGSQNGCLKFLDRVFRSGTSEKLAEQEHLQADGMPAYWSYVMWAILGPDENPVGVMIQIADSTEMALFRHKTVEMNEALLVSSVKQHALTQRADVLSEGLRATVSVRDYLLRLSDVLHQVSAETEIVKVAIRTLGEHLQVYRVTFAEIDADGCLMKVHSDWTLSGASSVAGQYCNDDFHRLLTAQFRDGKIAVVQDTKQDPKIDKHTDPDTWARLGCRAGVAYPLIKNGVLAAGIVVQSAVPHIWQDIELSLIGETAERVWAARQRLQAESKLRQSEHRQTFLLKFSDVLRSLGDKFTTQNVAMRMLCEHLNSTRTFYFVSDTTDSDNWTCVVESDYRRGGSLTTTASTHSIEVFGVSLYDSAKKGKIVLISDVANDLVETEVRKYLAIGVRAIAIVPLMQNGKFVAGIGVYHTTPHVWTPDEIELIRDVAVRTWSAVERARAMSDLAELNRSLEDQIAERTKVAENRALALRKLAAELSSTEHRERKRLAYLLHDDLQQRLVAARLLLPGLPSLQPNKVGERQKKLDDRLSECLAISRDLSKELSPPILERGSLGFSLKWLVDYFSELDSFTVNVAFTAEDVPTVPEHLHLFLFYATKELIFNSLKHSGGNSVEIEVSTEDSVVMVQVEDEGISFDPQKTQTDLLQPETFGLLQIRERLEALGGSLNLGNSETGGARIQIVVPLR